MHRRFSKMPPITQNSKVALTIGTIITCAFFLVGATWQVANTLSDIRTDLSGIRAEMRKQWTVGAQEQWAVRLERQNRAINLVVPSARDIEGQN